MPTNQSFFSTQPVENMKKWLERHKDGAASLGAGSGTTAVLNPVDIALYRAVINKRGFLNWNNFVNPMQGMLQNGTQKSLNTALYFYFQGKAEDHIVPKLRANGLQNERVENFAVGTVTGTINGMLVHPLSVIRYFCWGDPNAKFFNATKSLYQNHGLGIFTRSAQVTLYRDVGFAVTYEIMRKEAQKWEYLGSGFGPSAVGAGVATVLSAPMQYVRLHQLDAVRHGGHKGIMESFKDLYHESPYGLFKQTKYYLSRLKYGWGTGRVILGMAGAQALNDYVKKILESEDASHASKP